MQKLLVCAAVAAVLYISTAFAADGQQCPHQAPPCQPCGCNQSGEDCGSIPMAEEPCRILDPSICPGSDYCIVDTCRESYNCPCPPECYELLGCLDWSCNKCDHQKSCGCKQKSCGCKVKSCGCKEKSCGCKQKSCGCQKESCGCRSKCDCHAKCGCCTGDTTCMGYVAYESPAPRHPLYITMPEQLPVTFTPSPEQEPVMPPPADNQQVVKVIGRG